MARCSWRRLVPAPSKAQVKSQASEYLLWWVGLTYNSLCIDHRVSLSCQSLRKLRQSTFTPSLPSPFSIPYWGGPMPAEMKLSGTARSLALHQALCGHLQQHLLLSSKFSWAMIQSSSCRCFRPGGLSSDLVFCTRVTVTF